MFALCWRILRTILVACAAALGPGIPPPPPPAPPPIELREARAQTLKKR
ncbi:MAG TPA: hypothetical protein VM686_20155 [Polyangiaceae bacterium]|nr:hypothetical protein [Polyangiaceae bacterium]